MSAPCPNAHRSCASHCFISLANECFCNRPANLSILIDNVEWYCYDYKESTHDLTSVSSNIVSAIIRLGGPNWTRSQFVAFVCIVRCRGHWSNYSAMCTIIMKLVNQLLVQILAVRNPLQQTHHACYGESLPCRYHYGCRRL